MGLSSPEHQDKIQLSVCVAVTCEAGWVDVPAHLELMNTARAFTVKVDPRGLPHGAHFTQVRLPVLPLWVYPPTVGKFSHCG